MKHLIVSLVLALSLSACATDPNRVPRPKLPYPAWYVGLAAPKYMEVWVEDVDVLDQRGYVFNHVFGGVASYTGKAEGWHNGTGASKPINNVDLPERIILRWQSLVEPQAYKILVKVPQWVRDEMVKPERVVCMDEDEVSTVYRNHINFGMAPGGIVKVWVGSACVGYTEMGRYQAEVEPRGPYRGKSNGEYVPLEPENKAYVEQHGIPYGTW